jgi:Na+/H+ antiporter NhaD/arsenite permease-like protein
MKYKQHLTLAHALSKIDMSSLVFFVGILLAVATLEHTHILASLARLAGPEHRPPGRHRADHRHGQRHRRQRAAGRRLDGHVQPEEYPTDHFLWEFLAYCAGTGGSILIIGSAAGVAAMGLEKIHFFWYVKKISGLALVGYLAGAGVYLLQHQILA